ncbi:hypothetical protein [Paenibacillus sp. FSL L8-0641]
MKVSDTGCGINLEVKRVVDIVDCEISVESKAGKGSTLIIKMQRDLDGMV